MSLNRLLTAAGYRRKMTVPLSPRSAFAALRRLPRDRGGNVAIIFAVTSIPMLMTAGIVVDYGINASARQQAQNAVDATTLMLAKLPPATTSDADYVSLGKAQLKAAMAKSPATYDPFVSPPDRVNGTITVTLKGTTPTTLTRLAGFQSLPLNVTGTTTRANANLEIALVLDNTLSMVLDDNYKYNDKKMKNLQAAATAMVNNLFSQVDSSKPDALKIAVVPFSQTVNVGTSNKNAAWLDTNGSAPYNQELFSENKSRLALFTSLGVSWGGCVESRPKQNDYDVTDTTPTASNPATLFVPYFAPDESDKDNNSANDYINDYLDGDHKEITNNRTRQKQIAKYTSSNTWKKSKTAQDLRNLYYYYGPNAGCDDLQPITPLTATKSTVTTAIANMKASGNTNIPMGLVWGWHVLSPTEPFTQGVAYTDAKTRKFIILMTDGENSNIKINSDNGSWYSGISHIWTDRIGNFSESTPEADRDAAMDSRLAVLCSNIKNAGILIFTMRVEVTTGSSDLLKSCASASNWYYDVQDSSNLTAVFQSIGAQISELRISK